MFISLYSIQFFCKALLLRHKHRLDYTVVVFVLIYAHISLHAHICLCTRTYGTVYVSFMPATAVMYVHMHMC